ncbi:hypothetical protein ACXJJ3_32915 [Kribbella sp. WER1]
MNATEIRAAIAALPELPIVYADNMLYAQGWVPTAAERAAITARAEFFKAVGMPATARVEVQHFLGEVIGHLEFHA